MSQTARVRTKKMLLVAAVGVGTVSYLACSSSGTVSSDSGVGTDGATDQFVGSGNDQFVGSGNLVGPLPDGSSGGSSSGASSGGSSSGGASGSSSGGPNDAALDRFIISGNLVAPPPDAGKD
jgi:hypothetical protein